MSLITDSKKKNQKSLKNALKYLEKTKEKTRFVKGGMVADSATFPYYHQYGNKFFSAIQFGQKNHLQIW